MNLIKSNSPDQIYLKKSLLNIIDAYETIRTVSDVMSLEMDALSYPETKSMIPERVEKMVEAKNRKLDFYEMNNPQFS